MHDTSVVKGVTGMTQLVNDRLSDALSDIRADETRVVLARGRGLYVPSH